MRARIGAFTTRSRAGSRPAHGADELGPTELAPPLADVDVDDVRRALEVRVPHVVEQLGARHELARAPREVLEHRELARGQLDRRAGARHGVRRRVDDELAGRHPRRPPRRPAPDQRAQAREQLAEVEGLGEVVVGAGVKAADTVVDVAARGEDEDRHAVAALAQRAADLEPVAAREHQVEHHHVVVPDVRVGDRRLAVGGVVDGVALVAQAAADRAGQLRIVLNEQEPHGGSPQTVRA